MGLDPFAGSSTTGIAANLIGRRFLGIEKEKDFSAISCQRRKEIDNTRIFNEYRAKIKDIARAEEIQAQTLCANEAVASYGDLPF